jgi:F-type H+-transporting ATPase subunit delta
LIRKGREMNLPEITTAFIEQYKEKKEIHTLKLTTAVPVSDEVKQVIVDQVKSQTNIRILNLQLPWMKILSVVSFCRSEIISLMLV